MLSADIKPIMLTIVMLSVVVPNVNATVLPAGRKLEPFGTETF